VFPQALVPTGEPRFTFSVKSMNFFPAQLTVKDTCAECNSGVLSRLDGLAAAVLKPHLGEFVRETDHAIALQVDWDILCRWLLKLSFNMARVTQANDLRALEAQRRYILGRASRPAGLDLFGGLIRSCPYEGKDRRQDGAQSDWLDPEFHRISLWESPQLPKAFSISRAITFDAMTFVIAKYRPETNKVWVRQLFGTKGLLLLPPGCGSLLLEPSELDAASAVKDHILAHEDLYVERWGANDTPEAPRNPRTSR
jgi:hypothetical protein